MKPNNLSKEELGELVGGSVVGQDEKPTIINKNGHKDCICHYNNASYVSNDNTVGGCTCWCEYPVPVPAVY